MSPEACCSRNALLNAFGEQHALQEATLPSNGLEPPKHAQAGGHVMHSRMHFARLIALAIMSSPTGGLVAPNSTSVGNTTRTFIDFFFPGGVAPTDFVLWTSALMAMMMFFALSAPRLLARVVSSAVNFAVRGTAELQIGSIDLALLGGRVFLSDVVYTTRNTRLEIADVQVSFAWWLVTVRASLAPAPAAGAGGTHRGPRLSVQLRGVMYTIMNNSYRYDDLERLKRDFDAAAAVSRSAFACARICTSECARMCICVCGHMHIRIRAHVDVHSRMRSYECSNTLLACRYVRPRVRAYACPNVPHACRYTFACAGVCICRMRRVRRWTHGRRRPGGRGPRRPRRPCQ